MDTRERYLNNGHEWDEGGCCIHCGFDGAEYWWWRRDTYEGRALATPMPNCGKIESSCRVVADDVQGQ